MEGSQSSIARVPARCTAETQTSRATVAFEIAGYSLHKGLGRGKYLRSPAFSIGGYEWCIRYYPDGSPDEASEGYVSVFLKLLTKNAEVRATYNLMLVEPVKGQSTVVLSSEEPQVFDRERPSWGLRRFMKTTAEVEWANLWNDCLVIECEVTVIKETFDVHVPPSDLSDNLATLLEGKKGADVTFKVQGEVFSAHKILLAMRSPVFEAEFYGPLGNKGAQNGHDWLADKNWQANIWHFQQVTALKLAKILLVLRGWLGANQLLDKILVCLPIGKPNFGSKPSSPDITIDDMQPAVFRAFLHFIYTDSMPPMRDLEEDDKIEMVKHLLVAADKYGMERMKRICEGMLCKSLDVETVAAILALADQHHCSNLKDACIEFMLSSNRMNDVMASQGYAHLKRYSSDVIVDVFERAARSCKI
ncbi:BTB/POZ and MATH domain-containing protein 1-like [Aegilops tauschii subsp. strangulata]|uniref:BTB/POZ and MATH domain-containing protein 1-like n=1 Tax=Aegilops tauschii subsp. strangulata TaxID=200361 RepID=UPI00098ABAA3